MDSERWLLCVFFSVDVLVDEAVWERGAGWALELRARDERRGDIEGVPASLRQPRSKKVCQ